MIHDTLIQYKILRFTIQNAIQLLCIKVSSVDEIANSIWHVNFRLNYPDGSGILQSDSGNTQFGIVLL
jgi:hypothetical protein